jgi:hypothetical protein
MFNNDLERLQELQNEWLELRSKISELKRELNKQEKLSEQKLALITRIYFNVLTNKKKDENTISISPLTFSQIINALSYLENNGIVEQGFLNHIMEDIKTTQRDNA